MNIQTARQVSAQLWCSPETQSTEMDPVIAEAFAQRLLEECEIAYGTAIRHVVGYLGSYESATIEAARQNKEPHLADMTRLRAATIGRCIEEIEKQTNKRRSTSDG